LPGFSLVLLTVGVAATPASILGSGMFLVWGYCARDGIFRPFLIER